MQHSSLSQISSPPAVDALSILAGPQLVHSGPSSLYTDIARNFTARANDTALTYGDETISYAALADQTARVRDALIKAGVNRGQLIPIVTGGGPRMIAAMLGIWSVHAAFVPLATDSPAARRGLALGQIAAPIVLVDRAEDMIEGQNCISISELCADTRATQTIDPTAAPQGSDIAYGFFTSGSTGVPKCCLNIHCGLTNRARAMSRRFDLRPNEAVLQNSSHVFDSSLWQIFWPLAVGAEVAIPRRSGILDLHATLEEIEARRVVMTDFVPSILEQLVQLLEVSPKARSQLDSMRFLLVGGESLSMKLLQNFTRLLPHIRLINTYGPTEASIGMVFHEFTGNEKQVPLGLPIDNTALAVVDQKMRPTGPGELGEIVIGGACIGRGYLNDPDKTALAFLRDTGLPLGSEVIYRTGDMGHVGEDGILYFDGRLDDQVKIGGVRIELGEIEHHMRGFPGIDHAKVVLVDGVHRAWLAGFYIASRPICVEDLQDHLIAELGRNSVPSLLKEIEEFPFTASGKVDRKALIRAHCTVDLLGHETSPTPIGSHLLDFVQKLVPWRHVGVDDDLVAAGLDSLGLLSLVLEAEKLTGRTIDRNLFLDLPTISGILADDQPDSQEGTEEDMIRYDIEAFSQFPCPALPSNTAEAPREIVLTGATGYVGQALLRALLHDRRARITCIVRGDGDQAARNRLADKLPGLPFERVTVLAGDLVSDKPEHILPNPAQVIVHAAADVNFSKNYRQLRLANVQATASLCSFALACGARFHHVSSVATLAGGRILPRGDGDLPGELGVLKSGYAQTKWAAEQVVQSFRTRGLEASIYRLGEMMPDRFHPIANPLSVFTILCRAAQLVGAAPVLDEVSDYTPLGVVAKWIAGRVVSIDDGHENASVTLVSPVSVTLSAMFNAVLGPMRTVSLSEFRKVVSERLYATGNQDLARCLLLLPAQEPGEGSRMFQSPELLRTLERSSDDAPFRWPLVHSETLGALLEPVRRASWCRSPATARLSVPSGGGLA